MKGPRPPCRTTVRLRTNGHRTPWAIALTALLLAAPTATTAQTPEPLKAEDLTVLGLPYRAPYALIDSLLGPPDSLRNPDWIYTRHWLTLSMDLSVGDGQISQLHITGPGPRTARGLRVGDSVERAVALYGTSCFESEYLFCMDEGPDDQRGIWLMVENGRVIEITVGEVYLKD